MLSGYSRSGDMKGALEFFGSMPERNVVSWTAMISGYSQNGQYWESMDMFLRMEEIGMKPNEVTIASVFPACANVGALEVGERIEGYARANGLFQNLYVSDCVLQMYARCGKIEVARQVFDEIAKRRNLCSWNSMILGLAVHGKCNEALELYDNMLFVAGDNRKKELLQMMSHLYGIAPKLEHYGSMVDLLGRAGRLQEAYDFIKSMPIKPDSAVWGALLGACSFHNNVEATEKAAEFLFQLEPWNPENHVILSNIYASAGQWDGFARLKMAMKGGQVTKAARYSLTEEGGEMHKFIVEDESHPMWMKYIQF
ncbi:hypothetical protein SLEP1_g2219 [Rubroshorea leprosula]|uniref:Pentatricopeptide repeat-containing protein n=1 Tax=Rubroshorea leprosula TaxID=152421 RepID=A0AAV5HMC1_9ROSI|nr:hypothetical protein SLEP1_g2219 [Rubroshorea leprosula]